MTPKQLKELRIFNSAGNYIDCGLENIAMLACRAQVGTYYQNTRVNL